MELKNIGTISIKTNRLLLRQFCFDDNESMRSNWASDNEIQKLYSCPAYKTKEEADEFLKKTIEKYSSTKYYRWAITPIDDTQNCIGQIAYFLVNEENHWGEIEYCIGSEFQNKGFVTEAVSAILDFGFEKMNLHKVQVCHKEGNIPSKRVIEKNGFHYEGTLRDFFYMDGKYVDRLYYSLKTAEWKNRSK